MPSLEFRAFFNQARPTLEQREASLSPHNLGLIAKGREALRSLEDARATTSIVDVGYVGAQYEHIRHARVAQEKAVLGNIMLVAKAARSMQPSYRVTDMDDVQVGCIALMEAAWGYDADKGFEFSTYVYKSIVREMLKNRRQYNHVRVGSLRDARPDAPEDTKLQAIHGINKASSLDVVVGDGSSSLAEHVPMGSGYESATCSVATADPADVASWSDGQNELLKIASSSVDPRWMQAYMMSSGQFDGHRWTQREIADYFECEVSTVQGWFYRGRQRIRKSIAAELAA